MLTLMYISFVFIIPILLLFNFQCSALYKKRYTFKYIYYKMLNFIFTDILIYILIFILLVFIFPNLIWNFGEKAFQIEDQVLSSAQITPIQTASNNKIYVKANSNEYTVNLNGFLDKYDFKSAILDESDVYKSDCKIQYINEYLVYELKGHNILIDSINDMYANIYVDNPEKKLCKKFIKICIPKNSVK